MAENTKIEWAHHTFNGWIGCTKVGPGCDHCYAEDLSRARLGVAWGPGQPRRRTAASTWKQPRRWNNKAAKEGVRYRVFCSSLADVFDNEVPAEWRADLFQLIREAPHLDWLLVTKRVGNVLKMSEAAGRLPENVWLGITVVNQTEAERDIPKLRNLRKLYDLPVAFLSIEPMLEPIDLSSLLYYDCPNAEEGISMDPETGAYECCSKCDFTGISDEIAINWVIAGGESGHEARPAHIDWFRTLRDDCANAGVAFLFKQWGEWFPYGHNDADGCINVRDMGEAPGKWHVWGHGIDDPFSVRIGKKQAGRLLDGVQHDGVPA